MQTKIISVDVEWVGTGAKKYGKAAVKHDAGKGEKTQYLVSFKNPDVFKKVQELVGQIVEVENVKNGDFWEWKSINAAGGAAQTSAGNTGGAASTTRVTGSNYETKEERAARQVLIVKQSSLSAAVATLSVNPGKDKIQAEDVLNLAQTFTDWVFDKPEQSGSIHDMQDDIPF